MSQSVFSCSLMWKCGGIPEKCPLMCPNFGHIMDISLWHLTLLVCYATNVQKKVISLDTFWALSARLDMFWASLGHILGFGHIFGHIMDTFGDFASKMCLSLHCAPVPWKRYPRLLQLCKFSFFQVAVFPCLDQLWHEAAESEENVTFTCDWLTLFDVFLF